MTTHAVPGVGLPHLNLPGRLDALADLVRIGAAHDGFDEELISSCDGLLRRAGERLRLSASHTVVAIAGGTGSGKSSLFNALSGASFSPTGVTRPTTRHVHACVWGMQGAAPLLDWLGVQRRHRYARASALDAGEADLDGLLLLDLPDHDSVVTASLATVDRLTKLADMLIWVLDPQKYADDSVHSRYLIPLAGHSNVITVVLNQVDLLTPEQISDCETDLRRLLDSEGLDGAQLLPVSARTGIGLEELRNTLVRAVTVSHAASERIAADIDAALTGFKDYDAGPVASVTIGSVTDGSPSGGPLSDGFSSGGFPSGGLPSGGFSSGGFPSGGFPSGRFPSGGSPDDLSGGLPPGSASARPPWELDPEELEALNAAGVARPPWEDADGHGTAARQQPDWAASVPQGPASELAGALARAAGITAICDAIQGAREARASRYVAWPLAMLGHLRRRNDPLRGLGVSAAGDGPRSIAQAAGQPRQSDIDNAITAFADQVSAPLPEPWERTTREAARSYAAEVPGALSTAVRTALPERDRAAAWWSLALVWQWLLVLLLIGGLAWIGVIAALHGGKHTGLFSDASLLPWLAVMVVAIGLLGWLTSSGAQNMVLLAVDRERDQVEAMLRERVGAVAHDLVLAPTGREIAEYERFRMQLAAARGISPLA